MSKGKGENKMLVLTRKNGQSINIGDNIKITAINIGKNSVEIGIDAPSSVKILREELGISGNFKRK